ncbi:MAG: CotH kinase family protein, partial [Clostridia bacterium]|nr:CotH kinase family protein [Clostridia bacterium]
MNRRRNLMLAGVCVLLMAALLTPVAHMLSSSTDKQLDQKQEAISHALEMEAARKDRVYAQVQPVADIEAIWAIEDMREEADAQLVHGMLGGSGEMGFDAQSSTFYCTLGVGHSEQWPEIQLKAYGEEGVQVVWVDDYTYDWCLDAVAEGYRYELLAYTGTQYAYIGVVFTGLPIVTLRTQGEIDYDYNSPGQMTLASAQHEPVDTAMIVHERGGRYGKPIDKPSYRVEMYKLGGNGKKARQEIGLLGMKPDSEWLLLSNAQDESAVRNGIIYSMWKDWNADKPALMIMDNEYVEVFENDEYMGIYQLMERVKPEEEIALVGGDIRTDCLVRGIVPTNPSDKPVWNLTDEGLSFCLEFRYEFNRDSERAFELAKDYVTLSQGDPARQLDDEAFARLALERVDIEDMMNYIFFYHACTLRDNHANNIYLYIMRQEDGRYVYRHAPWDMDTGLWVRKDFDPHDSLRWPDMNMILPTRMLNLNVGNCREIAWNIWNEKRATILSREAFSARILQTEELINASGAYLRESQKWYG